jgi:hypothetical protein
MEVINDIMFTCCILLNMIVKDEKDVEGLEDIMPELQGDAMPCQRGLTFDDLLTTTIEIENIDAHYGLRGDIIEHLWALKGANRA